MRGDFRRLGRRGARFYFTARKWYRRGAGDEEKCKRGPSLRSLPKVTQGEQDDGVFFAWSRAGGPG
jgi:hypothetical protein